MRLKRLEICGFKTFPDKSVIAFPPGISAVVGPNGCGKSNIFDAIKWVMGEQSIKQLRGKSMGDVIFAGTQKRAPVNMAEVSLVLASEGTPEAHSYSEIMITRRLYRSGESAYLLNKQPCRLKDIHNLFLGAGMGSRSCAIVQQGNIGAITETSPEERRNFIEEAAGVMRYKTRKKEALAKVEETRRNLERVDDIVEEIEQHLSELSEQAETAKTYNRLQERIKDADSRVAVYYYSKYSTEISSAEARLKELAEKDTDHTESLEELNARLEKTRAESARQEQKVSAMREELAEKQRKRDRVEADLEHRRQETERLKNEIKELETSHKKMLEKNEKLEAEITEEEENEQQLTAAVESVEASLLQDKEESRDVRQQLESCQNRLEEEQAQVMELSTRRARYQNISQNARANKDNLKKRLKRLNSEETEALETLRNLTSKESEESKRLESLSFKREELREKAAKTGQSLTEKNSMLSRLVKTVNTLTGERSKLRSRLSALKKMEANYEWYREGVKRILKDPESVCPSSETGEPAIFGAVAEFVTPEPGFELALEACLGEALQYILVSDRQAGLACIDYLEQSQAGRCGFFALDQAGSDSGLRQSEQKKQAGSLFCHLRIREGFDSAIEALLGDALVAEDMQSAADIKRSCPLASVVTKSGHLLKADGTMIGGSADKLTGIYEKKHEIGELERSIADLDRRISREEESRKALESKIRSIDSALHDMNRQMTNLDNDIVQVEKQLYKTGEKLKNARRRHEIACLEKQRLEGEKQDVESEIQEHDAALEAIGQDIETAEQNVGETKAKIDELSKALKSRDQQEVDLKLKKTRLQAELDSSRQTLRRLRKFSEEGRTRLEEAVREIEEKKQKQSAAEEAVQSLAAALTKERGDTESLCRELEQEEARSQSLARQLKTTDSSLAKTRQHISANQEKRHKLELELSRLKINQDNIVNRFLETYNESFTNYLEKYQPAVTAADFSIEATEAERTECKNAVTALGEVNPSAIEAYEAQKKRYDFYIEQRQDLTKALSDLEDGIARINSITRKLFTETFTAVNEKFQELFPRLFEGGKAWLELTQPGSPLDTGVELMIHPPGKKLSRLSLLSGGEKALSAIAFIFSIFLINPASYCLLDEIDAPLDEANIHRFNELLKIIGEKSQIIMITHNKKSMEFSEALYGVTMGESGVSKIVSVDVDRIMADKNGAAVPAQNTMEFQ
ncbi:MAG: chromosome segregation protein SMC [Desulfosalsimonadaceae bacterium]